jgi:hypothetical protein
VHRPLHIVETCLRGTVVVGIAWDTDLLRALHELLAEGVRVAEVGDGEIAVAAPELVVGLADPLFAPAKIGKYVVIPPAAVAILRPAVEIHALAAIVDVAIDRARTAECLAARHRDRPAAGPFRGLGLVHPVHIGIVQRLDEASGDVDVGVPVRWPGFQDAHAVAAICAEPVGQDAAGRSCPYDHIIKCVRHDDVPMSRLAWVLAFAGMT